MISVHVVCPSCWDLLTNVPPSGNVVYRSRHQFRTKRMHTHDCLILVPHADAPWEERLAAKYYQAIVKEYAVVDLSRFKEMKVGLRWRTEPEVIAGKGQFECGSLHCSERFGLQSFEVRCSSIFLWCLLVLKAFFASIACRSDTIMSDTGSIQLQGTGRRQTGARRACARV